MPPSWEKWSCFIRKHRKKEIYPGMRASLCKAVGHQSSFLRCNWGRPSAPWECDFVFMQFPCITLGCASWKMFICWEFRRFIEALVWKHWHTNVDIFPFQDRANRLLSTAAKTLRLFNLLLLLFGVYNVCVCADSFKRILYGIPLGFLSLLPTFPSCQEPWQLWGLRCTSGPNGLLNERQLVFWCRRYKARNDVRLSPVLHGCPESQFFWNAFL